MENLRKLKLPGCAICSVEFSINGCSSPKSLRIPLLLHCAHSACDSCVLAELRTKSTVTCSTCKKVSVVPVGLTENSMKEYFPVNHYLCGVWFNKSNPMSFQGDSQITFSKPLKKHNRSSITLCNECTSNEAELQCIQCTALYCDYCFQKVHAAARALKEHKSLPINHALGSKIPAPSTFCDEHNQTLEFYCGQCDVTICSRCMLAHHNGHSELLELVTKNKEYKDQLIDKFVRISNNHIVLKSSKKQVKKLLSDAQRRNYASPTESAIRQHFLGLHGRLILLQNNLLRDVSGYNETRALTEVVEKIDSHLEDLENVVTVIRNVLRETSNANYIEYIKILKEKEKIPCYFHYEKASIAEFKFDPIIFEQLENHCSITKTNKDIYSLLSEDELPEGYPKNTTEFVDRTDIEKMIGQDCPKGLGSKSSSTSSLSSAFSMNSFTTDINQFIPSDDLVPGCTITANVSHIVSPSEFYIIRIGAKKKIEQLHSQLAKLVHTRKLLPNTKLVVGNVYLVLSKDQNAWARGKVLEIASEAQVNVVLIDYGSTELIEFNKIKSLPPNTVNIPGFALRCKLANCEPRHGDNWDLTVVALLARMIDTDSVMVTIVNKTALYYEVKLFKSTDGDTVDVAKSLCFLDFAAMSSSPNVVTPATSNTFKTFPLQDTYKQGDILDVSIAHVNDPTDLYLIISNENINRFLNIQDDLQRIYNIRNQHKYVLYDPKIGMGVAARSNFDKKWYRAIVSDLPASKKMTCFFIDYGNVEELSWKNVKVLANKFYRLCPQAYNCSLVDIDKKDPETEWLPDAKILLNELQSSQLKIVIQSITDSKMHVVLYKTNEDMDICINALLVQEKFATSTGTYSVLVEFPKLYNANSHDASQCEIKSEDQLRDSTKQPGSGLIPQMEEKYFLKGDDGCIKIQIEFLKIVDPGEFYVRLVYLKPEFKQLEDDLQELCSAELPPDEKYEWKIGEKCAVKLLNGKWCRGVLEEMTEDNQMTVTLPEHGSTATLIYDGSNLRALNKRLSNMRDGALKCHLGGLLPSCSNKWSGISKTELEEFVAMYEGFLYITKMSQGEIKDNSLPVELFVRMIVPAGPLEAEKDQWLSFNHLIRMKGYAKSDNVTKWDSEGRVISSPSEQVANILMENDIRERMDTMNINEQPEQLVIDWPKWKPAEKLPNLEFVAIPSFVNEDGDIYLRDFMLNSPKLTKITDLIKQEYTDSIPKGQDLHWQAGQICCSQFFMDNQYHRAEILGPAKENKNWFAVRFVDYGNEDHVEPNQLRQPICTDEPIQTHRCKLYKLKPVREKWEADHLTAIHTMIVDKFCRVKLVELPDGSYGIDSLVLPDNAEIHEEIVANRYGRFISNMLEAATDDLVNLENIEPGQFDPLSPTSPEVPQEIEPIKDGVMSPVALMEKAKTNEELAQKIKYKIFSLPENIVKFKAEVNAVLKSNQVAISFADTSDKQINARKQQYEEILGKMQMEAPLQPPIQPPYLYHPCCAQFSGDGVWYRAIVMNEEPDNKLLIQYIDYGNTEVLDVAHVHEIKEEWAQVEIQSIQIHLDGITLNDNQIEGDVMRKLYECLAVDCVNVVITDRTATFMQGELLGANNQLLYQKLIDDGSLKKIV